MRCGINLLVATLPWVLPSSQSAERSDVLPASRHHELGKKSRSCDGPRETRLA